LNLGNVGLGDSGNTYYCAVTSDYSGGTTLNSTAATLHVVATNPTNITTSVSGNQLTLSWPSDHTGWRLQSQTNSVAVGLGSNWADVAGATTTNQVTIQIDSANGAVFFRLVYP